MLATQHVNLAVVGFAPPMYLVGTLAKEGKLDFLPSFFVNTLEGFQEPITLLIFTVIAAAFALVPDFDEPNSTISRKMGFVGRFLSVIFRTVMGGHREYSHTLLFATVLGIAGFLLQLGDGKLAQISAAVMFVIGISLIARLILPFGIGSIFFGIILSAGIGLSIYNVINGLFPTFGIGFAIFAGINLHCLGDSLTPSRVKWLQPLYKKPIGLNINGVTGGAIERFVIGPILGVASLASLFFCIANPLLIQAGINLF